MDSTNSGGRPPPFFLHAARMHATNATIATAMTRIERPCYRTRNPSACRDLLRFVCCRRGAITGRRGAVVVELGSAVEVGELAVVSAAVAIAGKRGAVVVSIAQVGPPSDFAG